MDEKNLRILRLTILIFTLVNTALLIAYIIVSLTLVNNSCPDQIITEKPLFKDEENKILNKDKKLLYDVITKEFYVYENSNKIQLRGNLANRIDLNDYQNVIINKEKNNDDYTVEYKAKSRAANLKLSVKSSKSNSANSISCQSYDWSITNQENNYAYQEFEDCFNLDDFFWYGQSESKEQYWPLNIVNVSDYHPYLTGRFGDDWSSILERYWLSSSGAAVIVEQSVPLFVKKNISSVCLLASSKEPYHQHVIVKLKYDVCKIDSTKSKIDYLNKLQLFVINNYFARPEDIPDERMFKSPIWSSWANYKTKIDEAKIRDFANQITSNNYSHSQLEIDDKWQTAYGDFTFDQKKFPDMRKLVTELNKLDFRTTLWVHPFANIDSESFFVQAFNFLAVRAPDGLRPGFTSWWEGIAAIILDATNPNSTNWFVNELEKLRNDTGIDSFKFDAGEINWLPRGFWLYNDSVSPDQYSIGYAKMASRLGKMIEVRTGCQTQNLPIFVRMLDKDSKWGYDNGLKSVLTTGLVMSILGYPFILPDMIGGNAYIITNGEIDFETDIIAYPDYQLFIRWTQLTAFFPSMQFSIPPWHYNNETNVPVNQICKKFVDLHETLVYPLLIKYAKNAVATGEPIIRPIWWADNSDTNNLKMSDEFLVGNDILVAPITDENKYKRDVYLPLGKWQAENGTIYQGPTLLRDFPAPIETIPYFINKS